MPDAALAADEILLLQQRVGNLYGERERLRQRAAEREEQQEAVFDTLKQRVINAQTEIQVGKQLARLLGSVGNRLTVRRTVERALVLELSIELNQIELYGRAL